MTTETYTLPIYWASYLINGDASGLEDNEQEEIDAWMESEEPGDCVDVGEDYWFSSHNDAHTNLAGDVAEYTFLKN
jgi:hypothetical protein